MQTTVAGMTASLSQGPLRCVDCHQTLSQQGYIRRDDQPHCVQCYESKYSNVCAECGLLIATDSKDIGVKDQHWHERCFVCVECKANLIDRPFAHMPYRRNALYCAKCYQKNPSKCAACQQPFHLGAKKFRHQSLQWHEGCFKCIECTASIGTSSFIPHNGQPVCVKCYHDKYAFKCHKCHQVIDNGGLNYCNTTMHADCFRCSHCNKLLGSEQFAIEDNHHFCGDCYGQLFAKRCARCQKPITGFGTEDTHYMSFEGRNYHSGCFSCYKCGKSLVGKGVFLRNDNVVCTKCHRAR